MIDALRTRTALKRIQEYRGSINLWSPEERSVQWGKLITDVRAIGFSHPDVVLNICAGEPVLDPQSIRFRLTRDYSDTLIQSDIVAGRASSTFFVVLPEQPCAVLQRNYPDSVLRLGSKMPIIRTAEEESNQTIIVCLDHGVVNIVGHLRRESIQQQFMYEHLHSLLRVMVDQLGIRNVTRENNDLFVGGHKVAGARLKPDTYGLILAALYFSFDFDRTSFMNTFRDEIVYSRLPAVQLGFSEEKLLHTLRESWEIFFGFPMNFS